MPYLFTLTAKSPYKEDLEVYRVECNINKQLVGYSTHELRGIIDQALINGYSSIEIILDIGYTIETKRGTHLSREINLTGGGKLGVLRRCIIDINENYIKCLGETGLYVGEKIRYMTNWVIRTQDRLDIEVVQKEMDYLELDIKESTSVGEFVRRIKDLKQSVDKGGGLYRKKDFRYWVASVVEKSFRRRYC